MHAKEVHHRSNWPETSSAEESEGVPITTEEMAKIAISAYPTEPHDMSKLLADDAVIGGLERQLSGSAVTDTEIGSNGQEAKIEINDYSGDANNPDAVPTTGNIDALLGTTTQSVRISSHTTDEAEISRDDQRHQYEDETDGSNDEGGVRQALPVRSLDVVMAEPGKMNAATGVRNDKLVVRAFGGGKKINDESLEGQDRVEIGAPLNQTALPAVNGTLEMSAPAGSHVKVEDESTPTEFQVEVRQARDDTFDRELRQAVSTETMTRRQYRDLREQFEKIKTDGGTIDDVIAILDAKVKDETANEQIASEVTQQPLTRHELRARREAEGVEEPIHTVTRRELRAQREAEGTEEPIETYLEEGIDHEQETKELSEEARETLRDRLGIKGWSFAFAAKDVAADGMNAVMKGLRKIVYRSDRGELSDDDIVKMNETRRKVIAVSSVVVLGAVTLGKSILVAKGYMDANHGSGAAGLGEHVRHAVDTFGAQGGSSAGSSGNPEEIKATIQSEIDPSQITSTYLPIDIHENETMTQLAQSINGSMSESDILNTLDSHKADLLSKFGEEGGWLYENADDNGRLGLAKAGRLPQDLTDELYKIFEAKG